ncbi:FAD-binding oxidoreductase [Halarchaeum sp. P4]|uniref:FAD-binding oxidoreductase n=1 Tax=Halarchaeum sp. P4 TaxID=3421639 RepID=UPI003EBF4F2B
MPVQEYKARHDAIADLPLVTESAVVTDVTRHDRDRREEARQALERALERRGLADDYGLDEATRWDELAEALRADGHPRLARQTDALYERVTRPKPMVVDISFRIEEEFDYLAGQYVGLKYDGISRAYSLASAPTEDEADICVRRVPGGRLSPRLCEDVEPGDEVTVRGPYGDLTLDKPSTHDLVFLATGTGVAPFRGMINYVFDTGRDEFEGETRDVWLFLGAAWDDDLPFGREFRALANEHENFHFVPCLTREHYLTAWHGESDYVQRAFAKYVERDAVAKAVDRPLGDGFRDAPKVSTDVRIDPDEVDVYACGSNAMVFSLERAAEGVGVPSERIVCEGFG